MATGNAGRAWKNSSFTVQASDQTTNTTAIVQEIVKQYALSNLVIIPNVMLLKGVSYSITAVFCNFFGACGSKTTTTQVSTSSQAQAPIVSILGTKARTMQANDVLTLSSDAYVVQCSGARRTGNMQYTWQIRVSTSSSFLTTLVSQSLNDKTYILKANSLMVEKTYVVLLTAKDLSTGLASTANVSINVVAADLVASISPTAPQQLLQVGDTLSLDGLTSYDPNNVSVLSYIWTCRTVNNDGGWLPCAIALDTKEKRASLIHITANSSAVDTTSSVQLLVYDATHRIQANGSSSRIVQVIESKAPQINILTASSAVGYVNVDRTLVLQSTVLSSSVACNASWSSSTFGVSGYKVLVNTNKLTAVDVSMPAYALRGGVSYVFTISCGSSSLPIAVTTNSPPVSGTLSVLPAQGYALNTSFVLQSAYWIDNDLPMSFVFRFVSPIDGLLLAVKGKSETNTLSAVLPNGNQVANYSLNVTVTAEDRYGTTSDMIYNAVRVLPLPANNVLSFISTNFASQLATASTDELQNLVSVSSNILNAVNCSSDQFCDSLHRTACRFTPNTCGECLSGYTATTSGDSNTMCLSSSSISNYALFVAKACTVANAASTCASWQYCNATTSTGQCIDKSKECVSASCSSHGACRFFSVAHRSSVPACSIFSSQCEAKCVCASGYGGADCSSSTAELLAEQEVRSALLGGLAQVLANSNADATSLKDASNSLSSIVTSPYDVNSNSYQQVTDLAQSIITKASSIDIVAVNDVITLLKPLDAAMSNTLSSLPSSDSIEQVRNFTATLSAFQDLLSQKAEQVEIVQDVFRINSANFANADSLSLIVLSVPLTDNEERLKSANLINVPTVQLIPTNNTDSTNHVYASIVQLDQRQWKSNATSLQSNIISVQASNTEYVDVTMYLTQATTQAETAMPEYNFSITCLLDEVAVKNYTCPGSNSTVSKRCVGIAGVYIGTCPKLGLACSSLNLLDQTEAGNEQCTTAISDDSTGLVCRCSFNSSTSSNARRRLKMTLDDIRDSDELDGLVTLGLVLKYIASDLDNTFQTAPALTDPASVGKVYIIIVLYGSMWACAFIAMIYMRWNQDHHRKSKALKKSRKGSKITPLEELQVAAGDSEAGGQDSEARRKLAHYITTIFPTIFEAKSVLSGLQHELGVHHLYISFFFQLKLDRAPMLTVVKMMTIQSFMLFLLALLYDLNYPDDDGSCLQYITSEECLTRKYILEDSRSYCQWILDDSGTKPCTFANPTFSFTTAMYIAIFISIATCLLIEPLESVVNLISSPTAMNIVKPEDVAAAGSNADGVDGTSSMQLVANSQDIIRLRPVISTAEVTEELAASRNIPDTTINAQEAANAYTKQINAQTRPLMQRRESQRLLLKKRLSDQMVQTDAPHQANTILASAVDSYDSYDQDPTAIVRDYSTLKQDLAMQRSLLSGQQRDIFDEQWGIDPDTEDFLEYRGGGHGVWSGRSDHGAIHVADEIKQELLDINKQTDKEMRYLQATSDANKGFEILQLFVQDLLGRHTPAARIFACKAELDFERVNVVPRTNKILSAIFLFALNAFFIYYTLLKGLSKGLGWQLDFVKAWVVQLLLDMLLFETLQCMWIHLAVPYLVSKEVSRVYALLQETIQQLYDSSYYENQAMCLNAPDYLFVSHHVAKRYPGLVESTIVRAYCSHLPGEVGKRWQDIVKKHKHQMHLADHHHARSWSSSSYWIALLPGTFLISLLVQLAAYAPLQLQRLILRTLEPVLLSGLTIGFFYLVKHPVYLGVACIGIVLVLLCLLWDYVRTQKQLDNAMGAEHSLRSILPMPLPEAAPMSSRPEAMRSTYLTSLPVAAAPDVAPRKTSRRSGRHASRRGASASSAKRDRSVSEDSESNDFKPTNSIAIPTLHADSRRISFGIVQSSEDADSDVGEAMHLQCMSDHSNSNSSDYSSESSISIG